VIAENDGVVALNSALQVDLTGQVAADSLGYDFFSGIGGQVDFIRGAAMSRGGKPIIALPSTAKNGTISRIAPHLDEGAGVVTSRGDVHYIVTEWGVAYLHGKTIRERALALISVAHPDYRRELLDFVKERHYIHGDEKIWEQAKNPYPAGWASHEIFGGRRLHVRPIKATDERALQEFFYSHDLETVYQRYFTVKKEMARGEASHLCCVDYAHRMAFGVFDGQGPAERFVAVGRYDLNPRTNLAETALVVASEWRRHGIGTFLMKRLTEYAKSQEISGFYAQVIPGNRAIVDLHRNLGHSVEWDPKGRVFRIQHRFEEEARPPAESATASTD
jgi:GNAT superfamily N-acetyltransferase